jgi:aminoglycoside phosphotransferase (APT) family kinase protein
MDPRHLSIPGSHDWQSVTPILKGWSSDLKFVVTTPTRGSFLLRLFTLTEMQRKLDEYRVMTRLYEAGIPVNRPIDLGPCGDQKHGYLVCTWIEGEDLIDVLPQLHPTEQRQLGLQAGALLAKVHACAPLHPLPDWQTHFNAKLDRKITKALACPQPIPGRDDLIRYIQANRFRLADRPICLHHGDFHLGNLLLQPNGQLALIDLNRFDAGDPWEEFNRIVWDAQSSAEFASGRIDGYFHHRIPEAFFPLLALYIASNALSSVPWAIPFGEAEVTVMQQQLLDIQTWYAHMTQIIPSWYTSTQQSGS